MRDVSRSNHFCDAWKGEIAPLAANGNGLSSTRWPSLRDESSIHSVSTGPKCASLLVSQKGA